MVDFGREVEKEVWWQRVLVAMGSGVVCCEAWFRKSIAGDVLWKGRRCDLRRRYVVDVAAR